MALTKARTTSAAPSAAASQLIGDFKEIESCNMAELDQLRKDYEAAEAAVAAHEYARLVRQRDEAKRAYDSAVFAGGPLASQLHRRRRQIAESHSSETKEIGHALALDIADEIQDTRNRPPHTPKQRVATERRLAALFSAARLTADARFRTDAGEELERIRAAYRIPARPRQAAEVRPRVEVIPEEEKEELSYA